MIVVTVLGRRGVRSLDVLFHASLKHAGEGVDSVTDGFMFALALTPGTWYLDDRGHEPTIILVGFYPHGDCNAGMVRSPRLGLAASARGS
jgi:hypothetical protein